ncbi:MAG: type I phosphomannose isomerase catalytic subunit [Candidatus Goldiibacteriota bacterium]
MAGLYVMKVKPILKQKIWGGGKLNELPGIKGSDIGEAWFFADQPENNSIISNGRLKGSFLRDVMKKHATAMLGRKLAVKYRGIFPILVKFMYASDKLSVQVHPDDSTAKQFHAGTGKTEMWYIMSSEADSYVLMGFKDKISRKQIREKIKKNTLQHAMKKYRTKPGEVYYIPAGTLHALGPGNMLLEIQQNSDITFRLYDWGRINLETNRQLHIEEGLDVLKNLKKAGKIRLKNKQLNEGVMKSKMISNEYFECIRLAAEKKASYECADKNPCIIAAIKGKGNIKTEKWKKTSFKKGEIMFVPYGIRNYKIELHSGAEVIAAEIM